MSVGEGAAYGLVGAGTTPELQQLLLSYHKAGVLTTHQPAQGPGIKHERSSRQINRDQRQFMRQGITNNTTMNGMKHFKNQSLNF